jgi:hypothetical protein
MAFMKGHKTRELRIRERILTWRSVCNVEGVKRACLQARTEMLVHILRGGLWRYGLGDVQATK